MENRRLFFNLKFSDMSYTAKQTEPIIKQYQSSGFLRKKKRIRDLIFHLNFHIFITNFNRTSLEKISKFYGILTNVTGRNIKALHSVQFHFTFTKRYRIHFIYEIPTLWIWSSLIGTYS